MSQKLFPIDGGVQEVVTNTSQNRLNVLSKQYITAKHLENRPTEWALFGRPIYRRLPATGETYQIDFFNIVPAANTAVAAEIQKIGYTFVPWGEGLNSENSMFVSASESKQDLLIKGGTIVWEYGNTGVLPTIVNLPVIDAETSKYELAYQLIYDDSPIAKLYEVKDFALTGMPLGITSSTDATSGWRYSAVNAFLNTSTLMWANTDTYFPTYAQPTQSYIQWGSELAMAYSSVTLRCPPRTAYTGTADLSYYDGTAYSLVATVNLQSDDTGQFIEFKVSPRFQTGWKVEFSSLDVSVQSITISGVITMLEKQASASTRATLVMYPLGTLPKTVTNSQGEKALATYCPLATVDIRGNHKVESIEDNRYIIHRDYTPVADWLTRPFDETLVNLYNQVSDYSNLLLAPTTSLKQEYLRLEQNQVIVEA